MKAWLKGGLIGLGIGIFVHIVYFLIGFGGILREVPKPIASVISYLIMLPMQILFMTFGKLGILYFLVFPLFFIIGSFFGWIIGKIKSRNAK